MNLKNISIESTSLVFSAHSGLFLFNTLWNELRFEKRIKKLLPKKKRCRGVGQICKIKALLYSFAVGNDCLSDLDSLRQDIFVRELTGGGVASRTMGDFLVSFGNRHIERLQDFLVEMSFELRKRFFKDNRFILSMDSTPHEHFSKKMEGMDWNYKNLWCLDSQNAYDQYGLSYLFDLRPGNTFSGKQAELWVHRIFSKAPKNLELWFRADSAYGNRQVFSALKAKGVKFAIVLKENIGRYVRQKNKHSLVWRKTNLEFFNSKNCEVATGVYPLKSQGTLRVVFIRTKIKDAQLNLLEDTEEQGYRYYSLITNVDSHEMNDEEIIEFYKGRANCENYIREQKYGYDFLNFPCKKLRANKVFGLVGTMAHNLTRILSVCMDQKIKRVRDKKTRKIKTVTQLGYFAKKVRKNVINIPCQVIRSARKMKLRLSRHNLEVLEKILLNLNLSRVDFIQTKT